MDDKTYISEDLYESISEDIDNATTYHELRDIADEIREIASDDSDDGGRVRK